MNFSRPLFPFENADLTFTLDKVLEQYQWFGFVCGIVYVCSVFGLQWWMRERTGYKLRSTAVLWNLFLVSLNTLAAMRLLPDIVGSVTEGSFYTSVCTDRSFLRNPVSGVWVRMFPYMKIIELGDTILLVLQKRRLLTYYWTHHLGALLITWYLYPFYPTSAVWISMAVNFTHIPVYVYGMIRSCRISTSKLVPACLILLEIVHMAAGIVLCLFLFYYFSQGRHCTISLVNIMMLTCIYVLCFVLSTTLFCTRFLVSRSKISEITTMTSDGMSGV